jgi:hypothetical protein
MNTVEDGGGLNVRGGTGELVANFFPIMESMCVQCNKPIIPEDGLFYALTHPYYGCLHRWCAPYYQYPKKWPHTQPWVYYESKSK